jgi:hypothetical protein
MASGSPGERWGFKLRGIQEPRPARRIDIKPKRVERVIEVLCEDFPAAPYGVVGPLA